MRAAPLLLALTFLSLPLFAQNEVGVLATSHGGGEVSGPEAELESGTAFTVMVGLDRGERRRLDFVYAREAPALSFEDLGQTPGAARISVDIDYLHVGGRVLFQPATRIVPYIAMTAGATRFSSGDGESSLRASGALGGGVDLVLLPSVALRLDGRWYATLTGGGVSVSTGGSELAAIGEGSAFTTFAGSAGVVVRLP